MGSRSDLGEVEADEGGEKHVGMLAIPMVIIP